MTLSVHSDVSIGVYTVLVRLTDDNSVDPQSTEYKIVILINDLPLEFAPEE